MPFCASSSRSGSAKNSPPGGAPSQALFCVRAHDYTRSPSFPPSSAPHQRSASHHRIRTLTRARRDQPRCSTAQALSHPQSQAGRPALALSATVINGVSGQGTFRSPHYAVVQRGSTQPRHAGSASIGLLHSKITAPASPPQRTESTPPGTAPSSHHSHPFLNSHSLYTH
jgi:hypothetical protein